jgi:hypothetical protein
MKALALLFIALLAATSFESTIPQKIEDFLDGFFSAFGPWNIDFTACLKDANGIYNELIILFNEAKGMDWKNIVKLVGFVEDALDALKVAFAAIKDCKNIPDDMKAIIAQLMAESIHDHEMAILKNTPTIVKDGINFYQDLQKENYIAAGHDIGEILYIVLLAKVELKDPVLDVAQFIVGFFDAVGVDITVDNIKGCISNAEVIYSNILEVVNDLKGLDIKNLFKVIQAIQKIVVIVQEVLADISTCSAIGTDAQAIIKKIMAFDISKRTMVIISHFGVLVSDITTLISLVQINPIDTYKLGYTIGNIIDIVAIADSVSVDPDQIVEDFLKGFFDGVGIDIDISEIDECLDDADQIYYDLMTLMNDIKGMDPKNFNTMMKVITDIFGFVQDVMTTLDPCADSIPQLQKLIDRIMAFDVTKRIPTIIMYFQQLMKDVMSLTTDYANQDYKALGKDIGNIIYIVVLA